jgi:hypothetical protein
LDRTLANKIWLVGSRVKLCVQISQASDVGSIPIARSINPVDAVEFTGFPPPKFPTKTRVLDAVGRGFQPHRASWTRRFGSFSFVRFWRFTRHNRVCWQSIQIISGLPTSRKCRRLRRCERTYYMFDDLIDRPNWQLFGHREALHADHRPVRIFGLRMREAEIGGAKNVAP